MFYILWPFLSSWLMLLQRSQLEGSLGTTIHSLFLSHTWSTCPNCFFICPFFILLEGYKHVKCLSWTQFDPSWIMITISQRTVSAFTRRIQRWGFEMKKPAALVPPVIKSHIGVILSRRAHLDFTERFVFLLYFDELYEMSQVETSFYSIPILLHYFRHT